MSFTCDCFFQILSSNFNTLCSFNFLIFYVGILKLRQTQRLQNYSEITITDDFKVNILLFLSTLTRSSFMGCGISKDLICVTIGPSVPANTMVSPSFSFPLIKIQSIVVPSPGIALTSSTVAWEKQRVD